MKKMKVFVDVTAIFLNVCKQLTSNKLFPVIKRSLGRFIFTLKKSKGFVEELSNKKEDLNRTMF